MRIKKKRGKRGGRNGSTKAAEAKREGQGGGSGKGWLATPDGIMPDGGATSGSDHRSAATSPSWSRGNGGVEANAVSATAHALITEQGV